MSSTTVTPPPKVVDTNITDDGSISVDELAHWLLPRLKEMTVRFSEISKRCYELGQRFDDRNIALPRIWIPEVARTFSENEMLRDDGIVLTRRASTLLDRATLDRETRTDLKMRWGQAEHALQFSQIQVDALVNYCKEIGWQKELNSCLDKARP